MWVARARGRGARRAGAAARVVVATDGFLLGGFIALLAVNPDASGQGLGARWSTTSRRAYAAKRRWLFVLRRGQPGALRFYRRLGFSRVGRLPDLVSRGRVEFLLAALP